MATISLKLIDFHTPAHESSVNRNEQVFILDYLQNNDNEQQLEMKPEY